jgi:hypothetical protein
MDDEKPPSGRNGGATAAGVVLGLGLGFLGLPLAGVALIDALGGSDTGWNLIHVLLVPLVLGIVLLAPPRFRSVGAGALMGLAIGMIVGSSACLGFLALIEATYS